MIYNRGRTLLSGSDLTSGMQQEYREQKAAKRERTLAKAAKGILQKSRFYDKVGDVSEVLRKVEEKEEGAREKGIVQNIVQFRSRSMKFFGQPLAKVKVVFKKYITFLMGSDGTADPLIELSKDMDMVELEAELSLGENKEGRLKALFDFADKDTRDAVSSMPPDLSLWDKPTLLENASALHYMSEAQLGSLSATQVAWLTVPTVDVLLAYLKIDVGTSKLLKSEKVQKLLGHLHPPTTVGMCAYMSLRQ